jgi:hypothetical protein
VVRAAGALAAAERAVAHLTRPAAHEHFWVHVDADVLDDAVMTAVDNRQPGGLSLDELATVLAVAVATGRVAEVEVTIDNPALDPDGTAGAALTGALAPGLGAAPPHPPSRPRRRLARSSKQARIRTAIVPLAQPGEGAGTGLPAAVARLERRYLHLRGKVAR